MPTKISRYRGAWKDGAFEYETEIVRVSDNSRTGLFRKEFRHTADGLLVSVAFNPTEGYDSLGLYRHTEDIALPAPAKAAIGDMAWLAGAWVGTRGAEGATSIEERWSPPLGGAMLAVSRPVLLACRVRGIKWWKLWASSAWHNWQRVGFGADTIQKQGKPASRRGRGGLSLVGESGVERNADDGRPAA